ncbi:hypothetical protein [Pedobacter sp. JY14-1]|uniref:hypothetical protein n=1 Tax=Pedobacter sp. JY14-1 TaxID=3034151 RepID=UPI0023E2B55B|nr:hypothetical protein [Pedobacter sp. JY14-1]
MNQILTLSFITFIHCFSCIENHAYGQRSIQRNFLFTFDSLDTFSNEPDDWKKFANGYEVKIVQDKKHLGESLLQISSISSRLEKDSIAFIARKIDIPIGAKKVKLSGFLSSHSVQGRAGLSLIVNGKDSVLLSDEMKARAVRGSSPWKQYDIKFNIPRIAESVMVGIYLIGSGTMWADNLKLIF